MKNYHAEVVADRLHPNHWFNRASDLRAAAGAVWLTIGESCKDDAGAVQALGLPRGFAMGIACRPVYHMLCGLALEVIMKAVLVRRGETPPKTHDLASLAPLLDVALTSDEETLFQFYSSSIAWAGRYPVPNNPSYEKLTGFWNNAVDVLTRSEPIAPDSFIHTVSPSHIADWRPFHAQWQRFANMFHHRNRPATQQTNR